MHFEKIRHFEIFFSKCVKFGTKSTHFEKKISKCFKFGTNLKHFEIFFQSVLRVYIYISCDVPVDL